MKFLDYEKLGLLSEALAAKEVGDKVLVGRIEAYSCKPAGDDRKLIKELGSSMREECNNGSGMMMSTSLGHHHHYYYYHHAAASGNGNISPRVLAAASGSGFRTGSMPTTSGGGGGFSLSSVTSSPLGDLTDASTRKLLINLIATMNAAFPDYDFSGVRPEQFLREPDLRLTMNDVNRHLADLCEIISPTFLEELWAAIDEAVVLKDCEVFRYLPDMDHPFHQPTYVPIHLSIHLQELWAAIDEAVVLKDCEVFSYLPDMDGDPFSDGNLWSFNYFFVNRKVKRIVFFTCMAKSKFQSLDEEREEGESSSSPMRGGSGGGRVDDWRDEEQYWVDL